MEMLLAILAVAVVALLSDAAVNVGLRSRVSAKSTTEVAGD